MFFSGPRLFIILIFPVEQNKFYEKQYISGTQKMSTTLGFSRLSKRKPKIR